MQTLWRATKLIGMAALTIGVSACRDHMPHAFTWPAGGDVQQTHAKPPEGGYYTNWDPFACELEVTPMEHVNPVRTQHFLIATVKDKDGNPLPNRRVEWILNEGSVGDIVEVDESGWRASRGYKVDNHYAVSHTNNFDHVIDMGNDDPSDDIHLTKGQTWCVITSPIEGDSHVTVYAPGIYDRSKHKVFVVKHWYDLRWAFPASATNPVGTTHEFVTTVNRHSDNAPLAGYTVNYKILDGPPAVFEPGGAATASVQTDASGRGVVRLRQVNPAEGTNNIAIEIIRPDNVQCCKPGGRIATGRTSKTWVGPKIGIEKSCTPQALVGDTVTYTITVNNPSQVDATNVVVTDAIPDGLSYVSSTPAGNAAGQTVTWNVGTLQAAGRSTITVQAKANRTGRFENCASVTAAMNLSAKDCCETVVSSPKLVIEKTCPQQVTTCDPIEYVITVRNTGDGVAKNVRIEDTLPDGLTAADGRNALSQSLGDLGPGQSKEVRLSVRASRTGSFNNVVRAVGDGGLTAEASCTTVVRQPALRVTKTGPELRYIGRTAEYEITVTNTGDTAANQTVLVDPLPPGTQFNTASDGGSLNGGRVTWNLGTIEPGASRRVTVTLTAQQPGSFTNTATATAVCAEGSAEVTTRVEGIPAILLEVIDLDDPIEVGTNTTYEITVTNQGSANGTNIVVEATLPPEQEFVSGAGATTGQAAGQTIRFAPVPVLAPQAKATFRVVVKGVKAGDTRFKVTMKSDQIDSVVQETEATRIY